MNSDIKLAFFTNPQRETAVNGLQGAVKMAKSLGCKCYISNELKDSGLDGAEEIGDITPDFVLAFGGDGTILRGRGSHEVQCAHTWRKLRADRLLERDRSKRP